jgi:hypothetical protein
MTAAEWIQAFCDEIGIAAPSEEQADEVLRLAAIAAHASERTAAPIACWLGGSTGKPLAELIEVAEGLSSS